MGIPPLDRIHHTPADEHREVKVVVASKSTPGSPEMLPAFVKVNSERRRFNADQIAAFAGRTAPTTLWQGPFVQLGNSPVATFADRRTYVYRGKEVDQQTHLGFDFAETTLMRVVASNAGTVLHASWLGIYGNCVIVDHGWVCSRCTGICHRST